MTSFLKAFLHNTHHRCHSPWQWTGLASNGRCTLARYTVLACAHPKYRKHLVTDWIFKNKESHSDHTIVVIKTKQHNLSP